jgi:hypothetical protein
MDPSSSVVTESSSHYDKRNVLLKKKSHKINNTTNRYKMKSIFQHDKKMGKYQNDNSIIEQQQPPFQNIAAAVDPDLSADTHRYFAEARSTPIIYSTYSVHSTTSTSSSSSMEHDTIVKTNHRRQKPDDNRSLCSVHSFTAAQQQQMEYLNNRAGGSSTTTTHNGSTRNQVFYFGTPLPPQKQQPYQYHEDSTYYGDESNTPPWHTPITNAQSQPSLSGSRSSYLKRKKDVFLQSNASDNRRRLSMSGTSIKSAFSTGRQTIRSWRQKRINIMMKQHQLPDFETKAFCQVCEKYIQTRIRYRNGSMVWLMSFIL